MKKSTVLIGGDDMDLLTAVRILLKTKVNRVLVESNPENLLRILESEPVDVVLLDMNFKSAINTGNEGLFWLGKIKSRFPNVRVVMVTAYVTDKDLIANILYDRSLRAKAPYVKVDVGSLTETLFESELFGYRKGAFTDAREDRPGSFEAAQGGMLFLDEIGNIGLHQ